MSSLSEQEQEHTRSGSEEKARTLLKNNLYNGKQDLWVRGHAICESEVFPFEFKLKENIKEGKKVNLDDYAYTIDKTDSKVYFILMWGKGHDPKKKKIDLTQITGAPRHYFVGDVKVHFDVAYPARQFKND